MKTRIFYIVLLLSNLFLSGCNFTFNNSNKPNRTTIQSYQQKIQDQQQVSREHYMEASQQQELLYKEQQLKKQNDQLAKSKFPADSNSSIYKKY